MCIGAIALPFIANAAAAERAIDAGAAKAIYATAYAHLKDVIKAPLFGPSSLPLPFTLSFAGWQACKCMSAIALPFGANASAAKRAINVGAAEAVCNCLRSLEVYRMSAPNAAAAQRSKEHALAKCRAALLRALAVLTAPWFGEPTSGARMVCMCLCGYTKGILQQCVMTPCLQLHQLTRLLVFFAEDDAYAVGSDVHHLLPTHGMIATSYLLPRIA